MSAAFGGSLDRPRSLWDVINLQFHHLIEFLRRLEINRLELKARNDLGKGSFPIDFAVGAAIQGNFEN